MEPGSAASKAALLLVSLALAVGTLPKHRRLTKPSTAIPHGCFGSTEFTSNVVFLPFALNGSTGLQLRPGETVDLLSLRSAYFL